MPHLTAVHVHLRHEELLREAATHTLRSGRRTPRRPRRGRHRDR